MAKKKAGQKKKNELSDSELGDVNGGFLCPRPGRRDFPVSAINRTPADSRAIRWTVLAGIHLVDELQAKQVNGSATATVVQRTQPRSLR